MTADLHRRLAWNGALASSTGAADGGAGTFAATVLATEAGALTLDLDGGPAEAEQALSCLVRPEPGDRVLAAAADGGLYVLAVLARPRPGPVSLASERDITIASTRGSVAIAAAEAVSLDAGGRARVSAAELDLHAARGRFVIEEVLHVGRAVTAHVARLRAVGDFFETLAEHVLTRARRSSRFVEEADQLRSGEIDHRAAGTLQVSGRTTLIAGETLVRVDAEQIHMG